MPLPASKPDRPSLPSGGFSRKVQPAGRWLITAAVSALLLAACFRPSGREKAEVEDSPSPLPSPHPEKVILRRIIREDSREKWRFLFSAREGGDKSPIRIFGSGTVLSRAGEYDPERGRRLEFSIKDLDLRVVQSAEGADLILMAGREETAVWLGSRRLPEKEAAVAAAREDILKALERAFFVDESGRWSPALPEEERPVSPLPVLPGEVVFPPEGIRPGRGWESETPEGNLVRATFVGYTVSGPVRPAVIVQEADGNGFEFHSRILFDIEEGRILTGWFRWELGPALPDYAGSGMIAETVWKTIPKETADNELFADPR